MGRHWVHAWHGRLLSLTSSEMKSFTALAIDPTWLTRWSLWPCPLPYRILLNNSYKGILTPACTYPMCWSPSQYNIIMGLLRYSEDPENFNHDLLHHFLVHSFTPSGLWGFNIARIVPSFVLSRLFFFIIRTRPSLLTDLESCFTVFGALH